MPFDKTVFLPLDPDAVFRLVTEPERLRRWKAVAARVDLRVGGEYRWTILPGHSAAGTFTEIEPGKRVVLTWGWEGSTDLPPGASTVSITLDAVEGGTTLRLVHDGLTAEQAASHAEGWNHFLGRLVTLGVEGDVGPDEWAASPDPLDPFASAEAALAILQRVLRGVTAENVDAQTPCEDFTVVELVTHLDGSITRIGAALGIPVPGSTSSAGPAAAPAEVRIADIAQKTLEALRLRGLDGTLDLGRGRIPTTTVTNMLNLELLVHAWDLATATGQHLEVAPALSDYVLDLARRTITDPVRGSGRFHAAREVEDSASSLTRLLAFTGRRDSE
ncbi:TIGR03086 family metal-binding protein [Cryobacterium sp. PH31-AA6]|uniref:TIGR03086 family metal-binding protein n=1 Tax=Cryobacterium sp. PH31-AA6 TaxID=3046205 RepID=UPI0024B8BB57|nr:TIGR03086 family metal-binding protein [Cryobacterium sp. PH31-AA6]MDJ0323272.1 TIGR03086 family metal-binding protein [Cryobacterium sp. PH31-AA6]